MKQFALESISIEGLESACGGQNTSEAKGNIGVTAKGVKVGIQGEYKQSNSDYATCLKTMSGAGAAPTVIAETCGKPGATK